MNQNRKNPVVCLFLCLLLGLIGCSAPRYSNMMDRTRLVDLSARELRIRLNDLALTYTHEIEQLADRVVAEAEEPQIQQNARLLKMSAIPAVTQAFFLSDPLAALADSWTFNEQLENYFQSENGIRDFGRYHELGLSMTRSMDHLFRELGEKVGEKLDSTMKPRLIYDLALEYPIESPLCYRKTTTPYIADLQGQEKRDLIVAVGEILDRVYDLREHLDYYLAHLPSQARWQGELLIDEAFLRPEIQRALQDLGTMSTRIDEAVPVILDLPQLADTLMKMGLDEVDRQRILVLYAIAQERAQILGTLSQERELVLSDIDRQRLETFEAIARLKDDVSEEVAFQSKEVVDHAFLRLAQVLGGVIFFTFLGIFLLRLTRKR